MSFFVLLVIIAIGCIIDTLIGAWIGSTKGRTSIGATLGLLLGPIGWIIIALLSEAQEPTTSRVTSRHASRGRPCQFCGVLVTQGNSICTACGSKI